MNFYLSACSAFLKNVFEVTGIIKQGKTQFAFHRIKTLIAFILLITALFLIPCRDTFAEEFSVSGTITGEVEWSGAGNIYNVTGDVTVKSSNTTDIAKLTIGPGVTVKFSQGKSLIIGDTSGHKGKLIADGTNGRITFTANTDSPVRGYWSRIYFDDSTVDSGDNRTRLINCDIAYGGGTYGNIACNNSSPIIKQCDIRESGTHGIYIINSSGPVIGGTEDGNTITNNTSYGIYCSNSNGYPSIINNTISYNGQYPIRIRAQMNVSGNTMEGNTKQAIEVLDSDITGTVTWSNQGVPYVLTGNVDVLSSNTTDIASLTIAPGVTLKFDAGKSLQIGDKNDHKATLLADGTEERITFTANTDSPARGYWGRIFFDDSTVNSVANPTKLINCEIAYGGSSQGNISCYQSSPTIQQCTIRESANSGIYLDSYTDSTTPTIGGDAGLGNLIENNTNYGIYVTGGNTGPYIRNNTISGNGLYPIRVWPFRADRVGTNIMENNGTQAVEMLGGEVKDTMTWVDPGVPYVVTGNVTVRSAQVNGDPPVLILAQGVEL